MTTEPEFSVDVVEAAAAPAGTPPEFRERVALALKTTDERVLQDAEDAFRGIFASAHDYIVQRVAEFLPADLHWLLPCLDATRLRASYEHGVLVVWEIRLGDDRALIFESPRTHLARAGRRVV